MRIIVDQRYGPQIDAQFRATYDRFILGFRKTAPSSVFNPTTFFCMWSAVLIIRGIKTLRHYVTFFEGEHFYSHKKNNIP